MSSPERARRPAGGRARLIPGVALLAGLALASGCTVQPLYWAAAVSSTGVTGSVGNELSAIAISPAGNRVGQEVRNHLIFLFGNGQGEPDRPRYKMNLTVASLSEATANIQINRENEPTAAILTTIGSYTLTDSKGAVFSRGTQQFRASYDVPRQEFAALRARRDAENRSAREVAELLRMAVAQDLTRGPQAPRTAPTRPKSLF